MSTAHTPRTMPKANLRKGPPLVCAAATAITAAGFLAHPASAGAIPMVPLAPNCAGTFEFPAGYTIKQDNNLVIHFNNPATASLHNTTAEYDSPGGVSPTMGHVEGGINGENVDITVDWQAGPGQGFSNHYTGGVTSSGTTQGMSVNNKNTSNVWSSAPQTMICVPPPAPSPAQGPPQQQQPAQGDAGQPGSTGQATINGDVDVYDACGGQGKKVGMLTAGKKILLERRIYDGNCKGWAYINGTGIKEADNFGYVWGTFVTSS